MLPSIARKQFLSLSKSKFLPAALALLPFLYLVLLVYQYRVDVPFLDQWNGLAPLIVKLHAGSLTMQDLWLQHNEHRLIFPRIVMLSLALLSGWDIAYELAFSILLATITLFILRHLIGNTAQALQIDLRWLIPIISVMVFSLHQGENWLWGFELSIFMNVTAVVAGCALLHGSFNQRKFLAAIALGIVATYSFANGLLYWLLGFLTLLIGAFGNRSLMKSRMAIWAVAAGLTTLSYIYDFHTPANHPSTWLSLEKPLQIIEYALVYLGMPVASESIGWFFDPAVSERVQIAAKFSGFFGLIGFGYAIWSLSRRVELKILTPYLSLGLYAILSALATGLGRVGFGSSQAMSSRYVTISLLLWIALVILLFVLAKAAEIKSFQKFAACTLLIVFVGLVTLNSIHWRTFFSWRYEFLTPARAELFSLKDDDLLKRLFPSADYVRMQTKLLATHHLSVFRGH
jgi:hypothetical protein